MNPPEPPDSRFLVSRPVREYISVVLSPQVWGNLLQHPRKPIWETQPWWSNGKFYHPTPWRQDPTALERRPKGSKTFSLSPIHLAFPPTKPNKQKSLAFIFFLELRVKFYLGQNEDCSPGDSASDNSEKTAPSLALLREIRPSCRLSNNSKAPEGNEGSVLT